MIEALLFDGRSARGRPVRLHLDAGLLHAEACIAVDTEVDVEGPIAMCWPLGEVQWPERTRHGRPVIHLRDGSSLQVADGAAF